MNLLKDLSSMTNIKEYNFEYLSKVISKLIAHYVFCAKQDNQKHIEIDLDFAKLIIGFADDNIFYKFIPSKELNDSIKQAYNDQDAKLIDETISLIGQRIIKTYKELL